MASLPRGSPDGEAGSFRPPLAGTRGLVYTEAVRWAINRLLASVRRCESATCRSQEWDRRAGRCASQRARGVGHNSEVMHSRRRNTMEGQNDGEDKHNHEAVRHGYLPLSRYSVPSAIAPPPISPASRQRSSVRDNCVRLRLTLRWGPVPRPHRSRPVPGRFGDMHGEQIVCGCVDARLVGRSIGLIGHEPID